MLEIFCSIFTDVHFLGAFIQTVLLIFLGFILRRQNVFPPQTKPVLTTLVWKVTVPCFAFSAFMQDFDFRAFSSSLVVFVTGTIFYICLIVLGKLVFIRKGSTISTLAGLFFAIGQTTLFSMPILQSVYESRDGYGQAMLCISSFSIVFRIFVYIVGFTLISGERISFANAVPVFKKIFLTPVMIGMFSGIACFLVQNRIPFARIDRSLPALFVTVKSLSRMLNPCAMLLIGVTLGESDFKSAFSSPLAWIIAAMRNFIAPILILLLCMFLQKSGIVTFSRHALVGLAIGFSAPISVSLSVMCVQFHKEESLASRAVLLSTLMTIISLPLAFVLVYYCAGLLGLK